ncbi:hypothetical protein SEUCBS139899_007817 [Sporothrix eucalyptigena]|uniref:Fungal lipase-type domain-containing protein n=1 Tax=Sporothrix eucalyptigena TaxID=1812306 RepID=A0ABP0AS73_9PEZI
MKAASICGFALHIASLLAQPAVDQVALGGSNNGGSQLKGGIKEAPAALQPDVKAKPVSAQVPAQKPAQAAAPPPASVSALDAESTSDPVPAPGIPVPLFLSLERYARLVDIAYCVGIAGSGISRPFSCVSRCADFPEVRLISTFSTGYFKHDSRGFIAVDDSAREIIVAFRGTYSIANTVADLSTIPQKYVPYDPDDNSFDPLHIQCANCTVHSGFLSSWKSARHLVLPVVAEARNQSMELSLSENAAPYRVHLLGHSLGGAVAALAALEMKTVLGWEDVMVTTYGEPRVGNSGLATFLEYVFDLHANDTLAGSFRRVTHKDDPVPLLPLSEWGYSSHGGEIFIKKLDLSPTPEDMVICLGRNDPDCSDEDGAPDNDDDDDDSDDEEEVLGMTRMRRRSIFRPRLKLWELFFAHRDYFWRLGMCVPGSDPSD